MRYTSVFRSEGSTSPPRGFFATLSVVIALGVLTSVVVAGISSARTPASHLEAARVVDLQTWQPLPPTQARPPAPSIQEPNVQALPQKQAQDQGTSPDLADAAPIEEPKDIGELQVNSSATGAISVASVNLDGVRYEKSLVVDLARLQLVRIQVGTYPGYSRVSIKFGVIGRPLDATNFSIRVIAHGSIADQTVTLRSGPEGVTLGGDRKSPSLLRYHTISPPSKSGTKLAIVGRAYK